MSKAKYRWIAIISLLAALFLVLGLVLGMPKKTAFANTYAPSSIFSSGTGGSVGGGKETEDENAKSYAKFTFADDGKIHYRRNLALRWMALDGDTPKVNYFSTTFSFGAIKFESFKLTFESTEENISKDGKATNTITFEKSETEGKLDVFINKPKDTEEQVTAAYTVDTDKDVLISFDETDCKNGEFNVKVENKTQEPNSGTETTSLRAVAETKFKNIGSNYLEYRSGSKSNTPMTFEAKFAEGTPSSERQDVFMKELNGQKFELNADGRAEDNAPAVLVLNEDVYAFRLGQKFALSYQAIDVCDDSVTVTREYYMLKYDGSTPVAPNDKKLSSSGKEGAEADSYKEAEKYNYKSLSTSTYFLPSKEGTSTEEYVAIRFKLEDGTSDNDTYVYLNWYKANDDVVEETDCKTYKEVDNDGTKTLESETKPFTFIKVNRENSGPVYTVLTANEGNEENDKAGNYDEIVNAYQEALNDAASYEKSKTSAGTGAYIYLPSLRGLIKSDQADYRNLKFSIYYYKPSQGEDATASSQTSLSYNALKLEINELGWYKFRVLAQDSAKNDMEYFDADGKKVKVTGSNIWDIEGIPEFRFYIDYKGPTIEKCEEQSLGYRNDTYNFGSFDVVALEGYQKEYTLYYFNSANVPDGVAAPSSYSDFVERADEYIASFEEADKRQEDASKKILREIAPFQSDVSRDDEAKWNRTDNDYNWDADSSLSFIPQEAGFYVLKLRVDDNILSGKNETAYMVIEVRNPIDTIPGQSQWLQDNVVSVVLFAISGVLAIIVVALFLVKPSEKKVEEVDLEKLKGKKKEKKEKKK